MKHSRLIVAGTGTVLFFLLVGGAWVGMTQLIPDGWPQNTFIVLLGFLFLATYVWLLFSRVRIILAGTPHPARHGLIAAGEVVALLVAFGAVHQKIGMISTTPFDSPVVHDFWSGVYLSVATFTTLGFGDFVPRGVGRALAGMQALAGYIVLGLLASVVASVISPHSPAGLQRDKERQAREEGREQGQEEGREEERKKGREGGIR